MYSPRQLSALNLSTQTILRFHLLAFSRNLWAAINSQLNEMPHSKCSINIIEMCCNRLQSNGIQRSPLIGSPLIQIAFTTEWLKEHAKNSPKLNHLKNDPLTTASKDYPPPKSTFGFFFSIWDFRIRIINSYCYYHNFVFFMIWSLLFAKAEIVMHLLCS